MTSFNDGIEAAANHIRRQLKHVAPDQRVILSGLVYEIEALKRPEPSESAKLEWGEPDKSASYGYVLIATDDCDVTLGFFDQLYNCWIREDGSEIEGKVVATMPIPPAPL